MARLTAIVMMLCAAQSTLCQEFDCSTDSGQLAFLLNGAQSDPACYNPIINLLVSGDNLSPTEIEEVYSAKYKETNVVPCSRAVIDPREFENSLVPCSLYPFLPKYAFIFPGMSSEVCRSYD